MFVQLYQNAYLLEFHAVESIRLFEIRDYRELILDSIFFAMKKYELEVVYSIYPERIKFFIDSPDWYKFNLNFNTYTTMRLKQQLIKDRRHDLLNIFKNRYGNFRIWQPQRFPMRINNSIEFRDQLKTFINSVDTRYRYLKSPKDLGDRFP